ncbi:hypothetical protein HG263_08375 [Pseudoalteromonas sp. JBTF-M23]|uniref:Uncharacterized protein n=1 Tax=Pseudoalteromonas caenipelagi TaxID=2726988 RepID=A0A849VB90_9GAMM|nr:contractile injection system tape measure protein [Pseudoalteromonas caenipelagi]NOU50556.1 hypothetical protein [Pseudoalteromonas caenipelagi]
MVDIKIDQAVLDVTLGSAAVDDFAQQTLLPLVQQLLLSYRVPDALQKTVSLAVRLSSLELDLGELPHDEAQLSTVLRARLYHQLDDAIAQVGAQASLTPSAALSPVECAAEQSSELTSSNVVFSKHQVNELQGPLQQLHKLQSSEFASSTWCNALTKLERICKQQPTIPASLNTWLAQARQATEQAQAAKRYNNAQLQKLLHVAAHKLSLGHLDAHQFAAQLRLKLVQLANLLPASDAAQVNEWAHVLGSRSAVEHKMVVNVFSHLLLLLSRDNVLGERNLAHSNGEHEKSNALMFKKPLQAQLRKELKQWFKLLRATVHDQVHGPVHNNTAEHFSHVIRQLFRQLRKSLSVQAVQYRDLSQAQSLLVANQTHAANVLLAKHACAFKWLSDARSVPSAATHAAVTSTLNFLDEQKAALNQQLSSLSQLKSGWLTHPERLEQPAYWQQLKLDKQSLQRLKRAYQHSNESTSQAQQLKAQLRELTAKAQALLDKQNQGEQWHCPAGGLILLWPLLNACFAELGWLNSTQSQFINEQAQYQAMYLLAHLAGEQAQIPLSAALLVGLGAEHIEQPCEQPSEQMQQAGERMFETLLHHWQGFNTHSTATLRDLFIRRECVIEPYANGHRLTVQKQPQDALLQSLPFGIATIKLPWSELLIYGHWS